MTLLQSVKDQFNLRVYDENVVRIEKVLDLISEEEIWYRPNEQANAIGHLILHLCGNVNQWIGSGVGNQPDLRVRSKEFDTTNRPTKKQLLLKLKSLRDITDRALATIQINEDLSLSKTVQGYDETVLSIIIHVIEHFSYHTGQIAVIAKYQKAADLGFYADEDLDVIG